MVNKIYIESEMAWPDGSCETRPCAEKNSEGVYLAAVGTSRGLSPGRFSLEGNLRGECFRGGCVRSRNDGKYDTLTIRPRTSLVRVQSENRS